LICSRLDWKELHGIPRPSLAHRLNERLHRSVLRSDDRYVKYDISASRRSAYTLLMPHYEICESLLSQFIRDEIDGNSDTVHI
jgi:hypothetical protein